jgi:hypothetical protein
MAVGDDASAAGYPLVPDSGDEGKVKLGAREINRTRDEVAQVKGIIPASKAAYRTAAGITSGTADPNPATGNDGDIYFKIVG